MTRPAAARGIAADLPADALPAPRDLPDDGRALLAAVQAGDGATGQSYIRGYYPTTSTYDFAASGTDDHIGLDLMIDPDVDLQAGDQVFFVGEAYGAETTVLWQPGTILWTGDLDRDGRRWTLTHYGHDAGPTFVARPDLPRAARAVLNEHAGEGPLTAADRDTLVAATGRPAAH